MVNFKQRDMEKNPHVLVKAYSHQAKVGAKAKKIKEPSKIL